MKDVPSAKSRRTYHAREASIWILRPGPRHVPRHVPKLAGPLPLNSSLDVFQLDDAILRVDHDGDHVATGGNIGFLLGQVGVGQLRDPMLLVITHSRHPYQTRRRSPTAHFYEDQNPLRRARDDVDLTFASPRVAVHNRVAARLEIRYGGPFADLTERCA